MPASGGVDNLAPYFYVEPIEITIPEFVTTQVWSSEQTAVIQLDFGTNESRLAEEFPSRTKSMHDYKGIGLAAASKLDFVSERVQYSNNIKNADEPPTRRYYIDRTGQSGTLTLTALEQSKYDEYDAYGEQSKNKSTLGINGMYIDSSSKFIAADDSEDGYLEHIDVGLDYDVTNLPAEVFEGGYSLDFEIILEQKNDSDTYPGYVYTPVSIEDISGTTNTGYLDNFIFHDKDGESLTLTNVRAGENHDGYLYYTYNMPLSTDSTDWTLNYNANGGQKHFTSNISFDVKTEKLLKQIIGYKYANYRLKVTARISKGTKAYNSEDCIVYTNARVNAEYVVGISGA